ncbi:MAG: hypothetical protein R2699_04735 [Acidimicrobiales bacterium]
MGPPLTGLVVGDPPHVWAAAGFTVVDDAVRIGAVTVRCDPAAVDGGARAGGGILGWAFADLAEAVDLADDADPPAALDGLALLDVAPVDDTTPHPNGVIRIDHVVVATPDQDRTEAALAAVGFDLRRTRPTTYGEQRFYRAGEVIIEVIGPATPDPAHADRPARFFGLAMTTADLDGAAVLLGDALGRAKDAVQPGRRIATLRHEAIGSSVPVAFMTP